MRATIYDVAKRAGVGIGTVSRVINNSSQISSETRAKVLKTIKELNYQPHALAQGLARRRTYTLGAVVPFFTAYFYMELLKGIQGAVTVHNYDLILYGVDGLQKMDGCLKRVLQQRRVDGVLLISMKISDQMSAEFRRRNLPLVLVDAYHSAHESFTVNNEDGAYQAVKHLLSAGHDHIAFINGHRNSLPAQERSAGFWRAINEAGLPASQTREISSDALNHENLDSNDGFNRSAGYHAMRHLLSREELRPTAVFVASDIQALGAIKAIRESGLRIPDDIAIVGFDDVEIADFVGLTTMRQPIKEMGALAVDKLIEQIKREEPGTTVQHRFKTGLVVRDTCGAGTKAIGTGG